MTGMTSTIQFRMSFRAIASFLWSHFLQGLKGMRVPGNTEVVGNFTEDQRDDLVYEKLPLAPVSKFDDFELDLWMAKQSSEALHYHLVRGCKL